MTNRYTHVRRLPAEWEPHGAVLMAWPHADTDWAYMLDEVIDCYVRIADAIVREARLVMVGPDLEDARRRLAHIPDDRILFADVRTNDTWARDFGPVTLFVDGKPVIADFQFNGWGLKFASCFDNLVTSALIEQGILTGGYENRRGFVLEGGSIESDGEGTMLTTAECLLSPNRNAGMDVGQIESYLKETFGLNRILWLHNGALAGDDTDSHTDTLARLAPDHTIVYTATDRRDDPHYEPLQAMKQEISRFTAPDGKPYRMVELPLPEAVYDEDGLRLPATYVNYLIIGNSVLMPVYAQPQYDEAAIASLQTAFPNHNIVPVDCRALIRQHGSLHCVTMQLPNEILA